MKSLEGKYPGPRTRSPHMDVKDWILGLASKPARETIMAVAPQSVLSMFMNSAGVTIFMDKHFNRFESLFLDRETLFEAVRELVVENGIKKFETTFCNPKKQSKIQTPIFSAISDTCPWLKDDEIEWLVKNHQESFNIPETPKKRRTSKKNA